MSQGTIGAGWADMGKRSEIPTAEERAASAAAMRQPLPKVLHSVHMRYERLFDVWRVTFSDGSKVLRESRFEQDYTLDETFRRGRALKCLADRQAMELGMKEGRGAVVLKLDAQQYGALTTPL